MHWKQGLARMGAAVVLFGGIDGAQARPAQEPLTRLPRVEAERGRGGESEAVRFSISGARPWASAVLALESQGEGGPRRLRLPLVLDGHGAARRTFPEGPGGGWTARFVVPRADGKRAWVSDPMTPPLHAAGQLVQRGDLVVSEFMKDPSAVPDSQGEWIELYNTTDRDINIEGWTLSDGKSNNHTLANGKQLIVVPRGGYLVLGNNADPATNGGVKVHHQYSGFTLANGADSIILTSRSGKLVDRVDYDDGIFWPDLSGRSINLHPVSMNAYTNDDARLWCHSTTQLFSGATDTGTPGVFNDVCP